MEPTHRTLSQVKWKTIPTTIAFLLLVFQASSHNEALGILDQIFEIYFHLNLHNMEIFENGNSLTLTMLRLYPMNVLWPEGVITKSFE